MGSFDLGQKEVKDEGGKEGEAKLSGVVGGLGNLVVGGKLEEEDAIRQEDRVALGIREEGAAREEGIKGPEKDEIGPDLASSEALDLRGLDEGSPVGEVLRLWGLPGVMGRALDDFVDISVGRRSFFGTAFFSLHLDELRDLPLPGLDVLCLLLDGREILGGIL